MKTIAPNLILVLIAVGIAILIQHEMWHGNVWWALAGVPGLIVSYLIEGPHGGSHVETIWSAVGSTIANGFLYFAVMQQARKHYLRRGQSTKPPG